MTNASSEDASALKTQNSLFLVCIGTELFDSCFGEWILVMAMYKPCLCELVVSVLYTYESCVCAGVSSEPVSLLLWLLEVQGLLLSSCSG